LLTPHLAKTQPEFKQAATDKTHHVSRHLRGTRVKPSV
jgi:hypothetical protein